MWNYLRASLPFEIAAGVIGMRGDYDLASGGGPLGLTLECAQHQGDAASPCAPRGASQDYVSGSIEVDDARIDLASARRECREGTARRRQHQGVARRGRAAEPARPAVAARCGRRRCCRAAAAPAAASAAATAADHGARHRPGPCPCRTSRCRGSRSPPKTGRCDLPRPCCSIRSTCTSVDSPPPRTARWRSRSTAPSTASAGSARRARLAVKSTAVDAHVEAAGLGLNMLQPYLAQYTSMTLLQGALGAKLDIERAAPTARWR